MTSTEEPKQFARETIALIVNRMSPEERLEWVYDGLKGLTAKQLAKVLPTEILEALIQLPAKDPIPIIVPIGSDYLGVLAMRFRGTRNIEKRQAIAKEYAQTVERLIASGTWAEMPTFEDQLPDDWMPKEFLEYWLSDAAP